MEVLKDMKECFRALGLPILEEKGEGMLPHFGSEVRYGEYTMHLLAIHDVVEEIITVSLNFSHGVPPEARKTVIELLNLINLVI